MQAWEFKPDLPVFAAAWGQGASERVFFEEFQKLFKRLKKYYIFPRAYREANARGCLCVCECVCALKKRLQKEDTDEKKRNKKEREGESIP